MCAPPAGLRCALSGDGDARAMGRETAVSSSPPRISFQEENELYSPRLLFPFPQPPRVSNALRRGAGGQAQPQTPCAFGCSSGSPFAFGFAPGGDLGCSAPWHLVAPSLPWSSVRALSSGENGSC